LIVSGQISRQTALTELASPALEPDQVRRDIRFVAKKLGLSPAELDALISAPPIEHGAYPNQMKIIRALGRMQRLVRRFSLRAALGRAR
jgi:hypothetical protein